VSATITSCTWLMRRTSRVPTLPSRFDGPFEQGATRAGWKNGPRVSVLTTSYNHARWLPDTLNSVRRQDYPDVEHVVVDDGSSDESVRLLEARPPGSLLLGSTPHVGQSRALNEAFRISTGEIIGWLSSDDAYYGSSVVSEVVAAFVKHPEAALVYGHAVLIDAAGLQLQMQWVPPPRLLGVPLPMHILQPAAFVRRSALTDKMVDESFDIAMDTELWLRLGSTHSVVRMDRILAAERHHAARKSHTGAAVGEEELRRLAVTYGPAGVRASDGRAPRWRLVYRLAGLTLIPRVERHPSTFEGGLDSPLALIRRQSLARRSAMRSASDASRV
jgi:hypothetical protein